MACKKINETPLTPAETMRRHQEKIRPNQSKLEEFLKKRSTQMAQ